MSSAKLGLFREELREGEAERLGDACDVHERDVAESAFDAANVRPVNASFLGQQFLRPTAFVAECAHTSPELDEDGVATWWHGAIVCA
jgi:hypothetical protein